MIPMRSSRSSRSLHDDAQSDVVPSDDEHIVTNGGSADENGDEDEGGDDLEEDEYVSGASIYRTSKANSELDLLSKRSRAT